MKSMTARLFGLLMLATGIVWLCGMLWIYAGSRKELERMLDVRLEEATVMVASLMEDANVRVANNISGTRVPNKTYPVRHIESNFRLACQIWSIDGRLVGRSSQAPETQLTNLVSGYSNQNINGTWWRVYAREDKERGFRVLVGDSISHRERLVRELMWGLMLPGLIVLSVLSGLIWLALRGGLAPLRRLTEALAERSPNALSPLNVGLSTSEIKPVTDALNDLFRKLVAAQAHERSVTAFAAHELRTPLAGLRTQVQIALATQDADIRNDALRNAISAADRTSRMATQLLAIANIDFSDPAAPQEWMNVGSRLQLICDEFCSNPAGAVLKIDNALFHCRVCVNPDAFHMAARNLTENALQHNSETGTVRWSIRSSERDDIALTLEDAGPGIPEDEMQLVTQRFFRGRNKGAIGSGLGLSIAQAAIEKDGLTLILENRSPESGLRAKIIVPCKRVATDVEDDGETLSHKVS